MAYSIDMDLPAHFTLSIKIIAEIHYEIGKTNEAIFYFNQARIAALLLSQEKMVI